MKDRYLFFVIAGIFLLFLCSFTFAVPMLPTVIEGNVFINNASAPENTLVSVMINGVIVKSANTTEDGTYIIAVKGDENTIGKEITFYVDSIKTDITTTWSSGKVETINLTIIKNNTKYYIYAAFVCFIVFIASKHLRKSKK